MAHARGFRPRTQSRRQTAWGAGPNAESQSLSATQSLIWTNGSVLALEQEVTIVRVRGYCNIILEATAAIGDGFSGAIGIGLVSSAAFAAGVASVPTPITEVDWSGWLYHKFFDLRSITATIADGVNSVACVQQFDIDSKAMRKQGSSMTLMGVVEVSESGTATAELNADTRILDKLS